ncbi:branched-chain amino acid ABC transporter permease [Parvibaculum sp.]|jgi:branched-chain amino acid transport system permease protein|uniref:branched-chain amino acid ABC transporter permease n=1 Tax=Parvibaculum sp. TaxID=2024848 RepID=UPI000C520D13|nr:branched-chain amino acid ABC transporter permease [Parvibaculum sp.]MAM94812.1 branched-chain amino acid ABC transporter permease [Parvibaculum sp.]HCX67658.1 branched-chain amino acid ABC transporter permease [Rhodobiaceae bacterium]|tara:strand:+ start:16597 stop:17559 length:963 start_codon:yes stop_codon:yes gene_type:complete
MNRLFALRLNDWQIAAVLAFLGLAGPFLLPGLATQIAFLWLMVVFALTWDMLGGRMGYNSFGNIVFFGIGCYAAAVVQRDAGVGYFEGLGLGLLVGACLAVLAAVVFGAAMLGIRGHYFAIGTLGLGIAAGEIAAGWDYVGAGSGMALPLYPGELGQREIFFCYSLFALAAICFLLFRWIYSTRFGLALNAIRDDHDKADAMGLRTTPIKIFAWALSALFLGISGGLAANMIGFIDPRDVAFAGATFGVWMVLMAILGGKGTLWGPVLGAFVFHVTQELFWTYLLGWQRVALGLLIVVIVVFFPQGIMGWLAERRARALS